jgi:hypothetical protein
MDWEIHYELCASLARDCTPATIAVAVQCQDFAYDDTIGGSVLCTREHNHHQS